MRTRLLLVVAAASLCMPAMAQTVWTDWTSVTAGTPGTASGALGGGTVSYSGQVLANSVINGGFASSWAPVGSFVGGTVSTSPAIVGDIITLSGAAGTNTLTFSSPITDPVFAIWSLGAPGVTASFTFDATPTFEAGGPNVSFGGAAITVAGSTVSGREGNGVVQFSGTFSSISWTDTAEFYYGFTVGRSGAVTAVPEPATHALMLAGVAAVGWGVRRRRR